jgi:di/tricarboxylate transporter
MSAESWFTLFVVSATVVVLARDTLQPALAVIAADILLLVTGVISAEQALAGFSNPAPITVGALFIVARAVEKTGALQPLLHSTLGNGGSDRRGLARLLTPVASASAFLNNTPIVAMLAPQVASWAEKRGRSPSHYLMPLSFATILGGTITLIGTSTNLVVSGLMQNAGMPGIGMFELSLIGIPITVAGLLVVVALAPTVLPARRTPRGSFRDNPREFVCHATISASGPLAGRTVEAAQLRNLEGVFLAEIEREGERIAPVAPTAVLHGGDRLTFAGRVDFIRDLQSTRGLEPDGQKHAVSLNGSSHTFYEAVVSGASTLVGRTLKDVDFRSRYQAAVLAIHRAGERVNGKLGSIPLKQGDTLLLLADRGFRDRWADRPDFLLVSRLGGTPPTGSGKGALVGVLTLGIVVLAGIGAMPILHAALIAAALLVVARVLTPSEARGALDLDALVVIAGSFGIGAAIEASGLARTLADGVVAGFDGFGPLGLLLAIVLATVAVTELITNNAAAVLLFPIGLATAAQAGLDPRPFAIAITVAASASFLTPIGYQTNTMVYGLGGYRFADYVRLGTPLTLIVIATIMAIVPIFWPLVAR